MILRVIPVKGDQPPLLDLKAQTASDVLLLHDIKKAFKCFWISDEDETAPVTALAVPMDPHKNLFREPVDGEINEL